MTTEGRQDRQEVPEVLGKRDQPSPAWATGGPARSVGSLARLLLSPQAGEEPARGLSGRSVAPAAIISPRHQPPACQPGPSALTGRLLPRSRPPNPEATAKHRQPRAPAADPWLSHPALQNKSHAHRTPRGMPGRPRGSPRPRRERDHRLGPRLRAGRVPGLSARAAL